MTTRTPEEATVAPRVLVLGFGNPGRLDDGLGPALAAAVRDRGLPGVTVESNYQLSVEDAAEVARHDVVIFADAHVSCEAPFVFQRVAPRRQESFSSHSLRPDAVLGLALDLFSGNTSGYLLGIRGHAFNEFEERLSEAARANLDAALSFVIRLLEQADRDLFAQAADAFGAALSLREPPGIVAELARTSTSEGPRSDAKQRGEP